MNWLAIIILNIIFNILVILVVRLCHFPSTEAALFTNKAMIQNSGVWDTCLKDHALLVVYLGWFRFGQGRVRRQWCTLILDDSILMSVIQLLTPQFVDRYWVDQWMLISPFFSLSYQSSYCFQYRAPFIRDHTTKSFLQCFIKLWKAQYVGNFPQNNSGCVCSCIGIWWQYVCNLELKI